MTDQEKDREVRIRCANELLGVYADLEESTEKAKNVLQNTGKTTKKEKIFLLIIGLWFSISLCITFMVI